MIDKDVPLGKYIYRRPKWKPTEWYEVEVVDREGERMICFLPRTYPGRISNCPYDAELVPING